jgi:hypothetical protein
VGAIENTLPDRTVRTLIAKGKIYRDAAGRRRSESTLSGLTSITDQGAGLLFVLIAPSKQAFRIAIPKFEPSGRASFAFAAGSELLFETGKKSLQDEALGKQTIEGIEFEGSRHTTTMVDEPSKVAIDEYWISQEMGLIGSVLRSSPKGKTTIKIQNLVRKEPDPSLFVVPPDYTIQDMVLPSPPR